MEEREMASTPLDAVPLPGNAHPRSVHEHGYDGARVGRVENVKWRYAKNTLNRTAVRYGTLNCTAVRYGTLNCALNVSGNNSDRT